MNEIRYEVSEKVMKQVLIDDPCSIFLAGPTVRGHQTHLQPSWRFEACRLLRESGFNGSVIIPEFSDVTQPDKGNEDWIVPWEYRGLSMASVILFWVPRTKELIGLNTNFEFGYWLARNPEKIVYGRPETSYRNKYLDIMFRMVKLRGIINNSLESACKEAVNML
jgi:nucleoside 2-deoxyribosyltransferase